MPRNKRTATAMTSAKELTLCKVRRRSMSTARVGTKRSDDRTLRKRARCPSPNGQRDVVPVAVTISAVGKSSRARAVWRADCTIRVHSRSASGWAHSCTVVATAGAVASSPSRLLAVPCSSTRRSSSSRPKCASANKKESFSATSCCSAPELSAAGSPSHFVPRAPSCSTPVGSRLPANPSGMTFRASDPFTRRGQAVRKSIASHGPRRRTRAGRSHSRFVDTGEAAARP